MNCLEYSPQWYVLKIRTGWDEKISQKLSQSGYKHFVPLVEIPNVQENVKKKSLFPGYAFIYMAKNDMEWLEISNIYGIWGWVKFDNDIPFLTEFELNKVKKIVTNLNENGGLWNRYAVGDSVRIQNATMDTFGEVLEDAQSPDSFVQVIMQFMGRMVKASVHTSRLSFSSSDMKGYKSKLRRSRGKGRLIKNNI